MTLSSRIASINKSATLKITALTKKLIREGKDVINFAAGEPDFDTPAFIKDSAKRAIEEGFTKYTPSLGIPELREAIAEKLNRENCLAVRGDNIIVTSGAKYAIFATLFALLDSGDEVILPSPYWVSYPEMVKLCGGRLVVIPTAVSTGFKLDPQDFKKAVTARTKALILNYPNNPTGATYSPGDLKEIYGVVQDKKILVISDEIYETLTYDGEQHTSFASLPGAGDFTVTVNGFSKTYSMTGWRIGYLAASSRIIEGVSRIIDHTTSCASSVSQKAALTALQDQEWKTKVRIEFEKRRDVFYAGLSAFGKLKPLKPQGTFYLFCDIRNTGLSAPDFSTRLLENHLVSCIPADSFGREGFVRFSFSTGLEQINKGLARIKDFLQ